MKPHAELLDDDRDRAARYVLHGLEPDAAGLYEAHLAVCALCRAEVATYSEAVTDLAGASSPCDPPATLKARLMDRIRGVDPSTESAIQSWKGWPPDRTGDPLVIVRGGEAGWQDTAIDGIRVRRLFVDAASDRVTMLVRMRAGTSYPAHRHGGVEECYVLEGDIYGPDFEMKAGDYQRLEGGSVHGIQGTRGGCVLFIVSSMHDELLPAPR